MSRSPAPRRRATLASLAAELKVSRTTVSNAYNRPDQLSAELRERVLSTAKALGYPGPDPVARSLRTRKAGAVGLVINAPPYDDGERPWGGPVSGPLGPGLGLVLSRNEKVNKCENGKYSQPRYAGTGCGGAGQGY